mmetsp:Transcript_48939/g.97648  ORF Transcript_48939/g.97648 Transcript_48939/m.97648 type:complete len:338 (-) Transcript_48939:4-1017(-)
MEGRRLHPRVVSVTRVVDVSSIDDVSGREELISELLEACPLGGVLDVPRLLCELSTDSHRDGLARVDHPPRDGPSARVAPLYSNHLQLARPCGVEARDDRVGGVVGPPLTQQAAAAHPCAPSGVLRPLVDVEDEPCRTGGVRNTPFPVDGLGVGRVGPSFWLDRHVVLEYHFCGVIDGRVLREQGRPLGLRGRHGEARRVLRMRATRVLVPVGVAQLELLLGLPQLTFRSLQARSQPASLVPVLHLALVLLLDRITRGCVRQRMRLRGLRPHCAVVATLTAWRWRVILAKVFELLRHTVLRTARLPRHRKRHSARGRERCRGCERHRRRWLQRTGCR